MRAQTLSLAGVEFWLVGSPELLRTADGALYEYSHVIPEGQRLHSHATGPFCKFGLPAAPSAPGVYAILVGGELKYIGRCESLSARFSPSGYGLISPRNLHNDGQSTNCKINAHILSVARTGGILRIWFHNTQDFIALEAVLIQNMRPEWNGRPEGSKIYPSSSAATVAVSEGGKGPKASHIRTSASKEDFDRELQLLLQNATTDGHDRIEVSAGQLHKIVGNYPGNNHRMPVCCGRMRAAMKDGDRITYAPPKGNGARLIIEYVLPR